MLRLLNYSYSSAKVASRFNAHGLMHISIDEVAPLACGEPKISIWACRFRDDFLGKDPLRPRCTAPEVSGLDRGAAGVGLET